MVCIVGSMVVVVGSLVVDEVYGGYVTCMMMYGGGGL